MNKVVTVVCLALALSFFAMLPVSHSTYYCNIGTSNMEVGVYEPVKLQANKTYQFYIARIDSLEITNLNMTVQIKTNLTFTNNDQTIHNYNLPTMSFLGKREYTYQPVAYPFFLEPNDQVQVWLNISLPNAGNYTFQFNTDVQPILPINYTGPISVNNGKFNAKLTCIGKLSPTSSLIIDPAILGMGIGGAILVIIIIIAIRHRRLEHKKQEPLKEEPTEEQKKLEDMVPEFYKQEKPQ